MDKPIKAVAQVSKTAFTYVFNRITGEPVWPIEERPVTPSTVPGERAHPTQPFPTKPAPFDRQGISEDDLIDFTPEIKAEAKAIADTFVLGPILLPQSFGETKTSWQLLLCLELGAEQISLVQASTQKPVFFMFLPLQDRMVCP